MKCPSCRTENPPDSKFCKECAAPLGTGTTPKGMATETLATTSSELTTGSTFAGRYQIIEELGRGGMGRVYKVHDARVGEKVALKIIRPGAGLDAASVERFTNELKLARKIRHRNVCQMFDLGEASGLRFITMEYVHGEDLKQIIRKIGRLSPGQAIGIARQICAGLAEAHKLGVIHRDLKPQNIMLDEDGSARIMDFGIARSIAGKAITGAGIMIGTPEYMSPEQVEGKDVDPRSDIYSLGIMMYEMVTGRVPFEGDTPFTIGIKHKSEEPKDPVALNPQVPEGLNRVILRCLEKAPEKRFSAAADLDAALEKAEREAPATSPMLRPDKKSTSARIAGTSGRKKALIPVLLAAGALILGFAGWRIFLYRPAARVAQETPSVAVLPFEDLSPGQDQAYFCDGLTDELINRLAQVRRLRVPARTSVFSLKGKGLDVKEIGDKLKVSHVLEGSVRRTEDSIRVTVQLVKTDDGYPIWSERYNCAEKEFFSLQDEIALGIVDKMKLELLGEERERVVKRQTNDLAANDAYLKGLWILRNEVSEAGYKQALGHFEDAAGKDPDFAPAYTGIGEAMLQRAMFHFISADAALPKARAALAKALQLDEQSAEAMTQSAFLKARFEFDWKDAEALVRRAIELNPSYASAHRVLFGILIGSGRTEEAAEESALTLELDPLSAYAQASRAFHLYILRRYDEALRQSRVAVDFEPGISFAFSVKGQVSIEKSLFEDSFQALETAAKLAGDSTEYFIELAYAKIRAGRPAEGLRIVEELEKRSDRSYVSKYYLAAVQGALGNPDKAFELLDRAYAERDPDLAWLPVDPKFDILKTDSRFNAMLKKIGLGH